MSNEHNSITNIAHVINIQGLISQIYQEINQILPHSPAQNNAVMDIKEGLNDFEKTDLYRLQKAIEYANKEKTA